MQSPTKARWQTEHRLSEQENPASKNLDRMTASQIVRLMNREDQLVAGAVRREIAAIARAVDEIVRAIRGGGRLIYVGAGTSGRLAVLDAAECVPTFAISPRLVRAVIAGGRRALSKAVEGVEDSEVEGARDLRRLKITEKDVVVGLSASGTTPYVLGAIKWARARHAVTVALTVGRGGPLARLSTIAIAPEVGPEVLTGSTRLKAGTAQKMVLNMLSTASMVRLGHAYGNLMIDLMPMNTKLENRGLRMLRSASGAQVTDVERALRQAGHNLRVALVMLKLGVNVGEAKRILKLAGGNLREAMKGGIVANT